MPLRTNLGPRCLHLPLPPARGFKKAGRVPLDLLRPREGALFYSHGQGSHRIHSETFSSSLLRLQGGKTPTQSLYSVLSTSLLPGDIWCRRALFYAKRGPLASLNCRSLGESSFTPHPPYPPPDIATGQENARGL